MWNKKVCKFNHDNQRFIDKRCIYYQLEYVNTAKKAFMVVTPFGPA